MKLSIIICAYNERRTILEAIGRTRTVPLGPGWEREVIVVDNCSTDGTRELLQGLDLPDVRVVLHPRNLGKSASIKTGFATASGDDAVIFDADLEYDAADLPRLLGAFEPGEAVAVFGSRTLGGRRIYKYAQNYWGVRFLTAIANLLYGTGRRSARLTDIATGLKLVHLPTARALHLSSSDWGLDFELPCRLLKRGYPVREVPAAYHPRTVAEGKKIRALQAGLHALWVIVKTRFSD